MVHDKQGGELQLRGLLSEASNFMTLIQVSALSLAGYTTPLCVYLERFAMIS
jgi:hypothetical protein